MASPGRPELPVRRFASAKAFESWLATHHARQKGVWVQFAKRGNGIPSVYYPEALDAALCFGWIDGQVKALDGDYYLQRFTPRRPRSKWSKINCGKADALIAARRMRPAGLLQVEAAKADGRWAAAYDSPRTAAVPPELAAALAKNRQAKAAFAKLDARNRYAILYRIQESKRPQTRAKRVAEFVRMLAAGEKPHP